MTEAERKDRIEKALTRFRDSCRRAEAEFQESVSELLREIDKRKLAEVERQIASLSNKT